MQATPLTAHTGVEITGLDTSKPFTPDQAQAIRALFQRHKLIVVRRPELSGAEQVRLVETLAPLAREGDGTSDATYVSTRPNVYVTGRGAILMHADYNFTPHGQIQVISLYATVLEAPSQTWFTNQVNAARRLPAALRERLRDREVFQVQEFIADTDATVRSRWSESSKRPREQVATAVHPAIGRHPVTGEDVLHVSEQVTSHFVGMGEAESQPLFDELHPFQYGLDNTYVHDWKLGDLVIFDNVALQHGRPAIGGACERTLRRVVGNPVSTLEIMAHLRPDPARFIAPGAEAGGG